MKLANYLTNYRNSEEYQGLQEGAQAVVDDLWEAAFGLQEQIRVNTATYGLDEWEDMLGITRGIGMSYEARRERLIAKLRGTGTSTVEMIAKTVESFGTGPVQVVEHNSEYYFSIMFISIKGQPAQLGALKEAVEAIKPAHLGVDYVFMLTTHQELQVYTHGELEPYTHEEIQVLQPEGGA